MTQAQRMQQEIMQLRNMVDKQKLTIDSMRAKQKVLKVQNEELGSLRMQNIELKKSLMVLQNSSKMGINIINKITTQTESKSKPKAKAKPKAKTGIETKPKGDPKAALLAHFKKKQGKSDGNSGSGIETKPKGDPKAALLAHFKKKQGKTDDTVSAPKKGGQKKMDRRKSKQAIRKEAKAKGDPKAALLAHFKAKQGTLIHDIILYMYIIVI